LELRRIVSSEVTGPTLSRILQAVAKGKKGGDGRLQEEAHHQRSDQPTIRSLTRGVNVFHGCLLRPANPSPRGFGGGLPWSIV